jgi:hypothetical protein
MDGDAPEARDRHAQVQQLRSEPARPWRHTSCKHTLMPQSRGHADASPSRSVPASATRPRLLPGTSVWRRFPDQLEPVELLGRRGFNSQDRAQGNRTRRTATRAGSGVTSPTRDEVPRPVGHLAGRRGFTQPPHRIEIAFSFSHCRPSVGRGRYADTVRLCNPT